MGMGPALKCRGLSSCAAIAQAIDDCILARVPHARAHGRDALRRAVERAVDYALAVQELEWQQTLLAKLLVLTETETDMVLVYVAMPRLPSLS